MKIVPLQDGRPGASRTPEDGPVARDGRRLSRCYSPVWARFGIYILSISSCKYEFRQNIRSHSWMECIFFFHNIVYSGGVYFHFLLYSGVFWWENPFM